MKIYFTPNDYIDMNISHTKRLYRDSRQNYKTKPQSGIDEDIFHTKRLYRHEYISH